MPKVSVIACENYDPALVRQSLIAALEPLGGLDFVKPGMRIAIKANLITARSASAAATTHPVMLSELCRLICEKGGQPIVGDSPGGPFTMAYLKAVYAETGLYAVEKAGGTLNTNLKNRDRLYPDGKVIKNITFTEWLDHCDAIITFAKLKTHAMLGMTGAVKNQFGIVPGLMKPEYHSFYPKTEDFCNMLIDLNQFIKPRLAIIDAVVGMEGNGPAAGRPRKIGCVIASDSVYHADVAAADIIGLDYKTLPLLAAAVERGLAPKTVSELDMTGSTEPFRVPDYDNHKINGVNFGGSGDSFLMRAIRNHITRRPQVDPRKCIGCSLCAKNCPQKAITMKNIPKFNVQTCIRCFCCQEMCMKDAISVKTTLLSRLFN